MTFLFWGSIVAMTVVAIAVVVVSPGQGKWLLGRPGILVAVAVPLIAFGLYPFLGSPDAVTDSSGQIFRGKYDQPTRSVASVGSLVDGLKERLQQEPNNVGGWLLLARSYQHIGHHEEALLAYDRARSLGRIDLQFDELLPGGSRVAKETVTNPDPVLRGRVTLSSEAAIRVNPDDTIFIFAKESPQQRMPIVALRKPAADLPIDFVLTDAQAMVAGTHLADFETLVVTARVSRTGLATDAIEGLEVWSKPVSPFGGGEIDLLIKTAAKPEEYRDE